VSGPVRPAGQSRSHRLSWAALAGVVLVVAVVAYVIAGRTHQGAPSARSPASQPGSSSASAPLAPNGTFTTASGAPATIASLRGKPTMVWFVAGGCASCAASIPAVAAHLGQIRGAGTQVLTLGLYGAFPTGKAGVAQLLSFGRAAAGADVTRPGWTWGMASLALSRAYDPGGIPDVYVLVGPHGHIRYRNSVPVSTMPQLLAAAAAGEHEPPNLGS
jgi:hypothetical protein